MKKILLAVVLSFFVSFSAFAEEASTASKFHCEVLSIKGRATWITKSGSKNVLKIGDLLSVGDKVKVSDEGQVDLAFDKEWKNVARVESKSELEIKEVAPTKLDLISGSVFSKLAGLPKDSTFEVKTPTAVASVRGTEYRTIFKDGKTDIVNASSSKIYVYGVDSDGKINKDSAVILYEGKKTSVDEKRVPTKAEEVSADEKSQNESLSSAIQKNVEKAIKDGREAKIQSISEIESFIKASNKSTMIVKPRATTEELSRVEDGRRRAFGGDSELAPAAEPVSNNNEAAAKGDES